MNIVPTTAENARLIANIISLSNRDVATQFGIDQSNNPKHPSFYNEAWVLSDFEKGEEYFLCELDGEYAGCVAYEQPRADKCYLNRLAVLPSFRKQGVGETLTRHIFQYAKLDGASQISIGIIANHTALRDWYKKLGFTENGLRTFPHLPFDVLYMRYEF